VTGGTVEKHVAPCGPAGLSGVGVLGLGLVPHLWLAGGVAFVTYGIDAYGSVLFDPWFKKGSRPSSSAGRVG
jgi:hypothetical protein